MNKKIINYILSFFILIAGISCSDEYLEETPLDFYSPDNLFVDLEGFEAGVTAIYNIARDEFDRRASSRVIPYNGMSDVMTIGEPNIISRYDFSILNPEGGWSNAHFETWEWLFGELIPATNTIITRAENPDVEWTEEDKNVILGQARFFRAFAYMWLVTMYGEVPIVDREITEVKLDFTRAPLTQAYDFIESDLLFAVQNLPELPSDYWSENEREGRVSKGAANHLLAELYLTTGEYQNAVNAASEVIESGNYQLMTERFGSIADQPGDVFYDLFYDGNQNRSAGNLENIWVHQYEFQVQGGGGQGVWWARAYGPRYYRLNDYDGNAGMLLVHDSIGRGVGWFTPTNYFKYDIWQSDWDNDIRNSKHNIRREWVFNHPDSPYFGEVVDLSRYPEGSSVDTLYVLYPMIRKMDGIDKSSNGRFWFDQPRMRLAETYLFRAEAYIQLGDLEKAAADINMVRERAKATPVDPADVDIDYLLDERARELTLEENRMRTLTRVGKYVERLDKYNFRATGKIEEKNNLWPIPQSVIDSNSGAEFTQNPGY